MSVKTGMIDLMTHGIALFWLGACENWNQINASSSRVGTRQSYDSLESHVDAVLQWWLLDFAKRQAQENKQGDWAAFKNHVYYQTIRTRLLQVSKLHGRRVTTQMLFAELARKLMVAHHQLKRHECATA